MRYREAVVIKQRQHDGGTHSLVLGLIFGGIVYDFIGFFYDIPYRQTLDAVLIRVIIRMLFPELLDPVAQLIQYGFDRQGAGDFAAFVTSHAVRNYSQSQRGFRADTVLVI